MGGLRLSSADLEDCQTAIPWEDNVSPWNALRDFHSVVGSVRVFRSRESLFRFGSPAGGLKGKTYLNDILPLIVSVL